MKARLPPEVLAGFRQCSQYCYKIHCIFLRLVSSVINIKPFEGGSAQELLPALSTVSVSSVSLFNSYLIVFVLIELAY